MNIIFNSFPLPWPSFSHAHPVLRHARHFPSSCPAATGHLPSPVLTRTFLPALREPLPISTIASRSSLLILKDPPIALPTEPGRAAVALSSHASESAVTSTSPSFEDIFVFRPRMVLADDPEEITLRPAAKAAPVLNAAAWEAAPEII